MKKIIIFIAIGAMMLGCAGKQPNDLGVKNKKLKPCPASPNCVSSQETSSKHSIEPIIYKISQKDAYNKLKKIIHSLDRTTIVQEKPDYLYVEFKSRIFGFVDDVEFYFPGNGKIEVRSASRKGYSDLGVNRKRIENIKTCFDKSE